MVNTLTPPSRSGDLKPQGPSERSLKPPLRMLTVLVIVASLALVIRVGEIALGLQSSFGSAIAAAPPSEAPDAAPEPATAAAAPSADTPTEADASPPPAAEGAAKADGAAPDDQEKTEPDAAWRDATDEDIDNMAIREELLKEIKDKRQELDRREQTIIQREALLKAADQQVDSKVREMQTIKEQIENLLHKQSEEEEARLVSLVKIYEGMKPGDAARIFDQLDNDILVNVLSRMSERRIGPIMAEMNPEKAKIVTVLLVEQKKLPTLPEELGTAPPP